MGPRCLRCRCGMPLLLPNAGSEHRPRSVSSTRRHSAIAAEEKPRSHESVQRVDPRADAPDGMVIVGASAVSPPIPWYVQFAQCAIRRCVMRFGSVANDFQYYRTMRAAVGVLIALGIRAFFIINCLCCPSEL